MLLGQKRRNPVPRRLVEVAIILATVSTVAYVPDALLVAKIGTLVATITGRCFLSYEWFSTPLANLSYFHIFLLYIGDNFALFLPIFVNTCKPLSTHVN